AAGLPGDRRLVMNLDALVKEPQFRSYWIQDNVSELKQFASGVSDLIRTPTEIREERMLLRAEERPAGTEGSLGEVMRLVPDTAGLYRAWITPAAVEARRLVFGKIIAPSAGVTVRERLAPRVQLTSAVGDGERDLEASIDAAT